MDAVVIGVVQARMGSRRLPGKVLRRLSGKPLLQFLFDGLRRSRQLDELIVATSTDPGDDPVAAWCRTQRIPCYRGHPDNVASRFAEVIDIFEPHAVVRLCADSPLLCWQIVDRAVDLFRSGAGDLVTNVMPRTFPRGESVEVISAAMYRQAYPRMVTARQREHVTSWFYETEHDYHVHRMVLQEDHSDVCLAVDTPEDFHRVADIVRRLPMPHWQHTLQQLLLASRSPLAVGAGV